MEPTTLIYSSHSRSNVLHNDWLVQRALRGNKKILFLPMSNGTGLKTDQDRQEYSWSRFEWFFNYYTRYGLNAQPIYWAPKMDEQDARLLVDHLKSDAVVIFGGGNPWTGIKRYAAIGSRFFDDPDTIPRLIANRQERGLLTAGFSAGVDQLCEYFSSSIEYESRPTRGYGLARNIIALSHFEHGRENILARNARRYPECLVFGLPNDSGLAIRDTRTASGLSCQIIECIIDDSWDQPKDQWHIKTRQGLNIQHLFADGRHWGFNDGDRVLRIFPAEGTPLQTYIVMKNGVVIDYASRKPADFDGLDNILRSH